MTDLHFAGKYIKSLSQILLVHISSESQPGIRVNSVIGRGKIVKCFCLRAPNMTQQFWLQNMQTHSALREIGILEQFSVLKPHENSKFGGEKTSQHAHSSQDDVMAPLQTILDMTASNPPFTCSVASRRWAEERIQHRDGEEKYPQREGNNQYPNLPAEPNTTTIDLTSTSHLCRCSTWNGADSVVLTF